MDEQTPRSKSSKLTNTFPDGIPGNSRKVLDTHCAKTKLAKPQEVKVLYSARFKRVTGASCNAKLHRCLTLITARANALGKTS